MKRNAKIHAAVIGAGHGGKAMAADLAAHGHHVHVYNRTFEHIEAMQARGGIELKFPNGDKVFGSLQTVSSNMAEVLRHAQLVMVVVPAFAHESVAVTCAPHLRDGQVVVLHPGRTGGALIFLKTLLDVGCEANVTVAEASTLIFASRSEGPAEAHILRYKNSVPLAALPATHNRRTLELIRQVYPQFIAAPNVLHTSLNNMGAVFHPVLTLLNSGWIERTIGDFQFYIDGVTPSTSRVLEAVDRERVTVASALGIRVQTAHEWLASAYSAKGSDLDEAMHDNPGYAGIKAPRSLRHRYILEDVPCSLVPIADLGRCFGVDVRVIDSMIQLACVVHGTNYYHRGRTVKRMGMDGLQVSEIHNLVTYGTTSEPEALIPDFDFGLTIDGLDDYAKVAGI